MDQGPGRPSEPLAQEGEHPLVTTATDATTATDVTGATGTPPRRAPIELDDQRDGEPHADYQTRVLRFALRFGIDSFTTRQLEIADARAQQAVVMLGGGKLGQDAARLDERLHTLRLRLQTALAARRKARKAIEAQMAEWTENDAQEAAQLAQEATQADDDDEARALRLLRAALRLILQPPGPSGPIGGSLARLQPPGPDKGPGSKADDRTPAQPGRRF